MTTIHHVDGAVQQLAEWFNLSDGRPTGSARQKLETVLMATPNHCLGPTKRAGS